MAKTDEQTLIAACKGGDTEAMRKLYDRYAPGFLSLAFRYVRSRVVAEDVLQEAFINIFTRMDQFDGSGSLRSWMSRIVINEALQILRDKNEKNSLLSFDDLSELEQGFNQTLFERLSADDLMDCITELPEKYRTVFNMYALDGYTHAEIAKLLSIGESSSRSLFARARKMLQNKVYRLKENR